MGDIPLDAQRVVAELRASRREAATAPKYWVPSESFGSALTRRSDKPVHLNEDLAWMHRNWDLEDLLAPPRQRGLRGLIKRMIHRAIMALFRPYLDRLQHYLGANVRAVDAVSKRADDDFTALSRVVEGTRSDLVDLAHHVDESANA